MAFDYLGTYESLPSVADGANTCPDYLFFNARIILVVDHPTGSCQLVGASLDAAQLGAQMDALEAAINELPAQAQQAAAQVTPAASAPAEQAAPVQQTTLAASAQQAASPEAQATPAPSAQQAAEDTITAYPTMSDADLPLPARR